MAAKFRIGINYWPAGSAMHWWRRFDRAEVERDFSLVRAAGFDSVRIFLLWEDFQPRPDEVPKGRLEDLVSVAEIAAAQGLELVPTLFTGHMSGANWLPRWAIEPGSEPQRFPVVSGGRRVAGAPANWYASEGIAAAQERLAREVAAALRGHRAILAWDLGNENSNCAVPPARELGIAWLERISGAIRAADPGRPITLGLHAEDLEEDRLLGPAEAARVCDFLSMHGYPIYASWAEGPTDHWTLPFLGAVTGWLGEKEVLLEELGLATAPPGEAARRSASGVPLVAEEEAASFTRDALEALARCGFPGAMLWCFADYAAELWAHPPLDSADHERHFGLWRADLSEKPALAEVRAFADTPRREFRDDLRWIDLDRGDFYRNPRENLRRLYRAFRSRGRLGPRLSTSR
jgi:endo-1,4-beta-mannosidase